jgi:hypothetical protein
MYQLYVLGGINTLNYKYILNNFFLKEKSCLQGVVQSAKDHAS